jgi:hypothetical protein
MRVTITATATAKTQTVHTISSRKLEVESRHMQYGIEL